MKWDHPFGVCLADGDAQSWVAIRVRVQAVEGESGDLAAASAAPAQQEQRGSLVGIVQTLDGHHQSVQVGAWDEPGQAQRQLWQVGAAQEWTARHIIPAPLAGLAEEAQQGADVRVACSAAEWLPVARVDVGMQVHEETLEMSAVQLPESGDLRVGIGEPTKEVPERVATVADRLRPIRRL